MKEIERLPSCEKTTISVSEMKNLLGLSKVESYWLVHKECFETITANGRMRVVIASFEEWYAGQFHYKKVVGPAPGAKWRDHTISVQEAATMLGISDSRIYDLIKKGLFTSQHVDNRTRIDMQSFEEWFQHQDYYPVIKQEDGGKSDGINR